jgi:hypothetical protein
MTTATEFTKLWKTAKGLGQSCSNCPDRGFTVEEYANDEGDTWRSHHRQVQCEFCYCNPCSVYRIYEKLTEKEFTNESERTK